METADDKAFGERVKIIIRKVGSAEKLAKLTGMSASAIGQYATGSADPTRKKLLALAKAGNVNVEWLMTGVGPEEKDVKKDVRLISEDDLYKMVKKFVEEIMEKRKENQ